MESGLSIELQRPDNELRDLFLALQTRDDLASLLEVPDSHLIYYLYRLPPEQQYIQFELPKKSGGKRKISTPISPLKILQHKLNTILRLVYEPKATVHGFVHQSAPGMDAESRSIVTNAKMHVAQKFILNVDLKDFFPSINFGRVRGLFMATPYSLPEEVATILAQICCYKNQLPQGAPTSPIISNMICARMDSQLLRLAQKHQCRYTRYADDITFSTFKSSFPRSIAAVHTLQTGQQLEIGTELHEIIKANGFQINEDKVRLQNHRQRQEVTGLTVNRFTNVRRKYIRQIRAMLHAWEKFGLEAAEAQYLSKYRMKSRSPHKNTRKPVKFEAVVRGKIEFLKQVKGADDPVYRSLLEKYQEIKILSTLPAFTMGIESRVFISYSRDDEKFVKRLAALLVKQGINIWLDLEAISGGSNWSTSIQQGLKACSLMLLVLSPESMASSNVQDEWQYFMDQKKSIIPIRLKPTELHFQLQRIQYVDFHERDFNQAFTALRQALVEIGLNFTPDQNTPLA
ncbi:MAG TPA: TIR domain-containing protein [Phototrophicaceae bacterium]|jgi:RNA-directed DNA polymerase|nr:TIR domain-containing protein [Phototrophicaceae bacterium]